MRSVLYRIIARISFLALIGCAAPTVTPEPVPASTPTAAPSPDSHSITFTTPDGATLDGHLRGAGSTAVIFSVMGNCKQGWTELAEDVAQHGMLSLTYLWRGCRPNGTVDDGLIQNFVDDTRGAINFMREQGATRIVLVGASLGGCASAKLLVESGASGLIVLASPPEISQWGFQIDAADLQTAAPKLFITAENDSDVDMRSTRELYDLSAEPKEWQTYPGRAHGTDLFETNNHDAVQQRIIEFILMIQGS